MKFLTHNKSNIDEIKQLFTQTFGDSEGQNEGEVIGRLANNLLTTADEKDLYCFIATENERIVGSIIFTTLALESDERVILLSPVAVATSYQGMSVGQKLISFGLNYLRQEGYTVAVTYGDPNFYSRVGFQQITEEVIKAPLRLSYPHGWLAQSLTGKELEPISGKPSCVNALNNQEYW